MRLSGDGVTVETPALSIRLAIEQQEDPAGNVLVVHQTITRHAGRYKTADYEQALPALARVAELRSEVFSVERAK